MVETYEVARESKNVFEVRDYLPFELTFGPSTKLLSIYVRRRTSLSLRGRDWNELACTRTTRGARSDRPPHARLYPVITFIAAAT